MKILFPYYPLHSGTFPAERVQDGVVASCNLQIEILLNDDNDVAVISCDDIIIKDNRVKVIEGGFSSKQVSGTTPWTPLTKKILEVEADYDLIVLNMAELPMRNEAIWTAFEKILHKVRLIYHHYDSRAFSSFFVTQYQLMAWVEQNGGRTFTVSKYFNDYALNLFKKKRDALTRNPHAVHHLPLTYQPMRWLDMTVALEPTEPLAEDGGYVMIGRATPDKNILLGIKAFVESGVDAPLHVFTCPSHGKKEAEYFDSILAQDDPRVHVRVSAPRGEILHHLSRAECVLAPSKAESFGLVAMEALSYGCGLIYSEKHSFFADGLGTLVEKPTVKSFAKAIREHTTGGTKQERSDAFRALYSLEKFQERYCFNLLKG